MFRLLSLACLIGAIFSLQELKLKYESPNGDIGDMDVKIDPQNKKIYFDMKETNSFGAVEGVEDYQTGFAATKVESQEACFIRMLPKTFGQQVQTLVGHVDSPYKIEGSVNVSAIPFENPEEEVGEFLVEFCGEFPIYKLVKLQENEARALEDNVKDIGEHNKRQVTVTFTRCFLLCFIPICTSTTITVPTGSTIIFFWFFG